MCGIVAGIVPSKNQIQNTLLEGLKRLEYRGYDSAGMAWIDDQLNVVKSLGKVANLAAKLEHPSSAHIGIAHTRWATHGLPTQDNAHPHVSHGTLALVHNGIIENHQELRDQLEKDGYIFQSNTDSEVIVHLIHKMHQHYPMKQAIQQTIKQLEGSFAFVVLNLTSPNELYAATHRMPLVLSRRSRPRHLRCNGYRTDVSFIASSMNRHSHYLMPGIHYTMMTVLCPSPKQTQPAAMLKRYP